MFVSLRCVSDHGARPRDSLPSALSSDGHCQWEAKLKQANEFAEKSKAYFTSEYAQFNKTQRLLLDLTLKV